jgi:hypothetical protein
MITQWYYRHGNKELGPLTTDQMNDLVRQGSLLETDPVWRADQKREEAAPASTIFAFPRRKASTPLPDWLPDVETASAEPPPNVISEPQPSRENPEWLEDLRLWVGLEIFARSKEIPQTPAEITLSTPGKTAELPDWLESWKPPANKPLPTSPPVRPKAPPVGPPLATPVAPSAIASTTPVALATPVSPALPPRVVPREFTPAEKMRDESGFDADTGQILDPVKFQRWQRQFRASSPTAASNASLLEVFRKCRLAIEQWVDEDGNRLHILHADLDEIRRDPQIQNVIQEAGKFGKELQEKLDHHLSFMVENRRKYYKAVADVRR